MGLARQIFNKKMLVVFLMGISSGTPLLLIGFTLKTWLKDQGVDLATIGFFSLVGLPYTLKFLWSPLLDRFTLPFLGRRRGWLLFTQLSLMVAIAALGLTPTRSIEVLAALSFVIAFISATQDIVVDAYRRDLLADEELGLGSSLAINGYRLAIWFTGGFALVLADHIPWSTVYLIMASSFILGILATLWADEPEQVKGIPVTLRDAVILPFVDYFKRDHALLILAFILLYKIGDSMAGEMTAPFYLDLQFTKTEIGAVVKTFGVVATLAGAVVGGVFMLKLGIARSLWIFGFLQAASTAGFAVLAQVGHNLSVLGAVVAFENLTAGMGTAAYAGFMASICDRRFTATQYALLSSLMGVPRVIVSAPTGILVEQVGWTNFYMICTAVALPGILLLIRVAPWNPKEKQLLT